MYKFFLLAVTCCLSISSSYAQDTAEQQLRKTLEAFNLAFQAADTAALEQMLHEDYQHTNSGNRAFGKTAWLNWVASRRGLVEQGQLTYSSYQTRDLVIQLHGGFAVVTGRNTAVGVQSGEAFKVDIRFSHVWVTEQDRWQRLAFHDAPAKN